MTTVYILQFDKTFLDGPLSGLTVPGCTVTYSTRETALRHWAVLQKAERERDFCRDAVTGDRYTPSNAAVTP